MIMVLGYICIRLTFGKYPCASCSVATLPRVALPPDPRKKEQCSLAVASDSLTPTLAWRKNSLIMRCALSFFLHYFLSTSDRNISSSEYSRCRISMIGSFLAAIA